jgi:hypothetical protein
MDESRRGSALTPISPDTYQPESIRHAGKPETCDSPVGSVSRMESMPHADMAPQAAHWAIRTFALTDFCLHKHQHRLVVKADNSDAFAGIVRLGTVQGSLVIRRKLPRITLCPSKGRSRRLREGPKECGIRTEDKDQPWQVHRCQAAPFSHLNRLCIVF